MWITERTAPTIECAKPGRLICCGPRCAAWRWHDDPRPPLDFTAEQRDRYEPRAYCGLAGKPRDFGQ